jgi:hypothetical protein
MSISDLEWFVGFMEKKASLIKRYDTKALLISSKNEKFLIQIKEMLGLKVNPFINGAKTAYNLQIANNSDSELIYSILHKNIITESFLNLFNEFESKLSFVKNLSILSKTKPSITNAWLSGVIDARCSFSLDEFSPLIRIRTDKDFNDFIINLFPNPRVSKTELTFSGVRVLPLLAYLENYQPKLQKETYIWYNDYIKIWENKSLTFSEKKAKFNELKLTRPIIKV